MIQGPPGTGKRTVIKAIVERIKEIENGNARILISSTQHDAVDNAIDGITYGGVPVNRVLSRQKSKTEGENLYKWIDNIIDCCDKWLSENKKDSRYKDITILLTTIDEIDPQFLDNELNKLYKMLIDEDFSKEVLSKTQDVIKLIRENGVSNN